jgi:hypothetical protein
MFNIFQHLILVKKQTFRLLALLHEGFLTTTEMTENAQYKHEFHYKLTNKPTNQFHTAESFLSDKQSHEAFSSSGTVCSMCLQLFINILGQPISPPSSIKQFSLLGLFDP